MFNEICINEEMLPKYTYIYIYIYIFIYLEENSNYPDWEPLKQSLFHRKDNDKDLLETNSDQFNSGYHRGKER